jgi:hypothetical protein
MSNVHFISSSGVHRKGFLHWISWYHKKLMIEEF